MKNNTQIYGIRAVIEAINSNESIDKAFRQKVFLGNFTEN